MGVVARSTALETSPLGGGEGSISEFFLRLQKLREIDDVVDLSRSSMQLEVLLFMGSKRKVSIDELSQGLSFRRKALNDTLRKLINKKLIERTEDDCFALTEKGENYLRELSRIVGGGENYAKLKGSAEEVGRERLRMLVKELATSLYIYNVIVSLGMSKSHEQSLSSLSKLVGLSEVRLKSYLDLFTKTPSRDLRLFYSYEKPSRLSGIIAKLKGTRPKCKTYYRLSDQGLSVYYRLPHYMKFKRNIFFRIIQMITRTGHPEAAIRRIFYITILGTVSSFVALLFPPFGYLLAAGWLFLVMILCGFVFLSNF
ncbi:MAG TPA: hypothetical protein ENF82_03340 [Candidatus Methanomethylia archaeon]|nr:hypothetical protein [Candidatus Methanomethylicia archaeon]